VTDPNKTPPTTPPENAKARQVTKAEAAKAVRREVPVLDKEGKATGETKPVALAEKEVLAFAVRGDQITVVTVDGQKLIGKL
jgi:hypothetical protein